jgi:hypothetical protein
MVSRRESWTKLDEWNRMRSEQNLPKKVKKHNSVPWILETPREKIDSIQQQDQHNFQNHTEKKIEIHLFDK